MAETEAKTRDEISNADEKDTFIMPPRQDTKLRLNWGTHVIYFGDVDSTQQTFKCRFECWVTRELSDREIEKYKENPIDFEPNCICQVFPVGCCEIIEREMMEFNNFKTFKVYEETKHYKTYVLERAWLITCLFVENLELENFPFDVQHFEMIIQFRNDVMDEEADCMEFKIIDEMTYFRMPKKFGNIVGWDIVGIELPTKEHGSRWDRERGMVFILKRHWKFYIYRVIMVMFVVGLITLSLFTFGEDAAADKFGFISTMLLTVVAYMFIIKEYLPLLNYLTLLDIYVYFVLVFILVISVECFVTSFSIFGDLDSENIDFILFVIDLVVWIVVHFIFIIWAYKLNARENEKTSTPKFKIDEDPGDLQICDEKGDYDRKDVFIKEGCYNESVSYFTFKENINVN